MTAFGEFNGEAAAFAKQLAEMKASDQDEFFRLLGESKSLTKEEITSMQIVVAYFKMLLRPEETQMLKTDLGEAFYKVFTAGGNGR